MAEVIPLDMVKTQSIGQSAAKLLNTYIVYGEGSETRCLWVYTFKKVFKSVCLRYSPSPQRWVPYTKLVLDDPNIWMVYYCCKSR